MPEGFTRCPQIYDGGGRKTRTSWFESRGTSAQWIHGGRGCNLWNFIMIYKLLALCNDKKYGKAYHIFLFKDPDQWLEICLQEGIHAY